MAEPIGHIADKPKIIVIGAGLIGLGIAWRLAQRGAHVAIYDRNQAGQGASHAAAGMLAACAEAEPGEQALVGLCRNGQARWPAFADELEQASGLSVDLRREGTLVVAPTADDRGRLQHQFDLPKQMGLPVEWISPAELRRREPHLGNAAGAVWSPEDHQVDNRKVVAALRVAAERAGVSINEHAPVKDIGVVNGRASHITLADGSRVAADRIVLAAGAWSREIAGLPVDAHVPVRPVKGQMVALQMDAASPLINHVIWAPGVYLVPRRDGRLLIGATVEEKGFDKSLTAGGMLALLEAAWRVLPAIEELPIVEQWVGHRPGSRDDAPIIGPSPVDGLIYATGHHRNGVLLTPLTADVVAGLVLDGAIDPIAQPFGFARFARAHAA